MDLLSVFSHTFAAKCIRAIISNESLDEMNGCLPGIELRYRD